MIPAVTTHYLLVAIYTAAFIPAKPNSSYSHSLVPLVWLKVKLLLKQTAVIFGYLVNICSLVGDVIGSFSVLQLVKSASL